MSLLAQWDIEIQLFKGDIWVCKETKKKHPCSNVCLQHQCDAAAVYSQLYVWELSDHVTADRSFLSLLRAESSDCQSSLWPSSTHCQGWAQLAPAISRMLRGRASCQSGSWVDPDNIVRILSEPCAVLLHQLIAGNSMLSNLTLQQLLGILKCCGANCGIVDCGISCFKETLFYFWPCNVIWCYHDQEFLVQFPLLVNYLTAEALLL